jgi:uncharacterized phiE125 gp8 family phage protein
MYSLRRLHSQISTVGTTAGLAVSLDEAKKEVEVATAITYHDEHLARLIKAATQQATVRSGRQLLTAAYRLTIDTFPCAGRIALPLPPLQSVQAIRYFDAAGEQQTLATTVYRVLAEREPAEICLRSGQAWPTVYDEPDAVEIDYTAGVADNAGDLPEEHEWFRQAILMLVKAYWMRDHNQPNNAELRAADMILEAHRCGDDLVEYWDA